MNKAPIIRFFYQKILKKIFFRIDPEVVHDHMVSVGKFLGNYAPTQRITRWLFNYTDKKLQQTILGITFSNPVGLSAGFDKNAELTDILPDVGFGFVEVGSVTGEPCSGNAKPRLWRLPKTKGLVVYYGLKNDGCEKIAARLTNKKFRFPIGISIAKTNCQATADTATGIADYVKAYTQLKNIGDYITINISCPNAFGGQPFTDKDRLEKLLTAIDSAPAQKPLFLKISPDLTDQDLADVLAVAQGHNIAGFVCTNLTKNRDAITILDANLPDKGGISGKVLNEISNKFIAKIYTQTHGQKIIIGVGGIFSAADAYEKIKQGASLVQLITGMIFEGPQLIGDINRGLVTLLEKDGYTNIAQAVGANHK
jgi:dihydroorotate dehydrogenase